MTLQTNKQVRNKFKALKKKKTKKEKQAPKQDNLQEDNKDDAVSEPEENNLFDNE